MTIVGGEKPSLDELMHFGVKGMKWGQRKAATGKEIVAARRRLIGASKSYRKDFKAFQKSPENSARRAMLEDKLRKQHQAYLNNPDRVIANRMTKGEKFSSLLFAGSGAGAAISLASIATTSAVSRRIEFKQAHGGFKVSKNSELKSHLGFQRGRKLALAGAAAVPGLMEVSSSAIVTRAAANRNAAKVVTPTAIGSAASKLKYVKPGLRGVHKITTLK